MLKELYPVVKGGTEKVEDELADVVDSFFVEFVWEYLVQKLGVKLFILNTLT